ncbi:hypothetical protein O5D80_007133 [Batrachochytrium dendrobatidis]|nr:hypothetical protein O5D80_007133 [Batrachochytrium dendrobatidis]
MFVRHLRHEFQVGYKEGIIEGKETHIQAGFDLGYKDGFMMSHGMGQQQGILAAVLQMCTKETELQRTMFKLIPSDVTMQSLNELYAEYQSMTAEKILTADYYKSAQLGALSTIEPDQITHLGQKLVFLLEPILHEPIFAALQL